MDYWHPRSSHRGDAGVRLRKTDLDHGQHSAFSRFANNYWCRAGDPCKSLGRHAVCSPCHTGASDAAHSTLELISLTRSPPEAAVGRGHWARRRRHRAGFLMTARGCREQWQRPAIPGPRAVSDAYIDQCMAATLVASEPNVAGAFIDADTRPNWRGPAQHL
jgi:hypothetical protein